MDELVGHTPAESVDLASLFFVLSAIAPDNMVDVLKNVFQVRSILHEKYQQYSRNYAHVHTCTHYIMLSGSKTRWAASIS